MQITIIKTKEADIVKMYNCLQTFGYDCTLCQICLCSFVELQPSVAVLLCVPPLYFLNFMVYSCVHLSCWVCALVWPYSAVALSKSLCTGMMSWPRKRLMIGLLFANLSFTSTSNTSVTRATNVYFYKTNERKTFSFVVFCGEVDLSV